VVFGLDIILISNKYPVIFGSAGTLRVTDVYGGDSHNVCCIGLPRTSEDRDRTLGNKGEPPLSFER